MDARKNMRVGTSARASDSSHNLHTIDSIHSFGCTGYMRIIRFQKTSNVLFAALKGKNIILGLALLLSSNAWSSETMQLKVSNGFSQLGEVIKTHLASKNLEWNTELVPQITRPQADISPSEEGSSLHLDATTEVIASWHRMEKTSPSGAPELRPAVGHSPDLTSLSGALNQANVQADKFIYRQEEFIITVSSAIKKPAVLFYDEGAIRELRWPKELLRSLTESKALVNHSFPADSQDEPLLHNALNRLYVGSDLHPFILRKGDQFIPKKDQIAALKELNAAVDSGIDRALIVATTGFGKTYIIDQFLKHQSLKQQSHQQTEREVRGGSLNIVVAQNLTHLDLIRNSLHLTAGNHEIWGGDEKSNGIGRLAVHLRKHRGPYTLLTTIQTFRNVIFKDGKPQNLALLLPFLRNLIIDEGHNSGAPLTSQIIDDVYQFNLTQNQKGLGDKKVFVLGLTATPIHYQKNILAIFKNIFWASLSDQLADEVYLEKEVPTKILNIIQKNIEKGEITPIKDIQVVYKNSLFDADGKALDFKDIQNPMFINEKALSPSFQGIRFVLNPKYYEAILEQTLAQRKHGKKSLIICSTVNELKRVKEFLLKSFTEEQMADYYGSMELEDKTRFYEKIKKQETLILLGVRALSESLNVPELELYIDLNKTISAKDFLQRTGRTMRLSPGKNKIKVVLLMEINAQTVENQFTEIIETISSQQLMDETIHFDPRSDNKFKQGPSKGARPASGTLSVFSVGQREFVKDLKEKVIDFWQSNGRNTNFYSYWDARAYMQTVVWQGKPITTSTEFSEWSRSGEMPPFIPKVPAHVFQRDNQWQENGGWPGFLRGEEKVDFYSFEEAREYIRGVLWKGEPILTQTQFWEWSRSGEKPPFIPKAPAHVFQRDNQWQENGGWPGFLRGEVKLKSKVDYYPYERARDYIRGVRWKGKPLSSESFKEWTMSGERPPFIPRSPDKFYKSKKQWDENGGWPGFLRGESKVDFYPYERARDYIRGVLWKGEPILTQEQYYKWVKSGEKPHFIPSRPDYQYSKSHSWDENGRWAGFLRGEEKKEIPLSCEKAIHSTKN